MINRQKLTQLLPDKKEFVCNSTDRAISIPHQKLPQKIKENPEVLETPQAKAIMLAFGLTPSGLVFGPDADAIEKDKEARFIKKWLPKIAKAGVCVGIPRGPPENFDKNMNPY